METTVEIAKLEKCISVQKGEVDHRVQLPAVHARLVGIISTPTQVTDMPRLGGVHTLTFQELRMLNNIK